MPGSYPNSLKQRKIMPLRHSRLFKVTDCGTNRKLIYDFPLVINSNLPPILHRFWDIAVDRSEIAILGYPSCLTPPAEGFPWDNLCEIFSGCQWMAQVPNAVEILPKIWTTWVGCTNVTDDRQTDRWQQIANVFAKKRSHVPVAYYICSFQCPWQGNVTSDQDKSVVRSTGMKGYFHYTLLMHCDQTY